MFAPIVQILASRYGWRGGLIIIGAVLVQTVLFAALLRPLHKRAKSLKCHTDEKHPDETPRHLQTTHDDETEEKSEKALLDEESSEKETRGHRIKQWLSVWFGFDMLKDPKFILFLAGRTLVFFGTVMMSLYGVSYAVSCGIDKIRASLLLTLLGACSAIARFIVGGIASLACVDRLLLKTCSMLAGGAVVMLASIANQSFISHAMISMAFGLTVGE